MEPCSKKTRSGYNHHQANEISSAQKYCKQIKNDVEYGSEIGVGNILNKFSNTPIRSNIDAKHPINVIVRAFV